jgi:hypothetical protein
MHVYNLQLSLSLFISAFKKGAIDRCLISSTSLSSESLSVDLCLLKLELIYPMIRF